MKKIILILSIVTLTQALAQSAKDIIKTKGCISCHGKKFEKPVGARKLVVNTLSAKQIESDLMDFKTGKKKSAFMQMQVNKLSIEDIKALAKYIPTLK
ncbi:c-type cytochrome [Helicobacter cetorum]|uniref:Cytochrome c-553 n=1 Tax=Helicobacter cetorum (strain ATCC BAA-429 / MIT 00-7128) TaxID=182217 RepID=I0ELJ2_HELC0|nr:c-type cytochrome [Helicobacter cetorum]AFI03811.1 cytochrome c-553 [Helicobacter cetorum MIT 00-7128]